MWSLSCVSRILGVAHQLGGTQAWEGPQADAGQASCLVMESGDVAVPGGPVRREHGWLPGDQLRTWVKRDGLERYRRGFMHAACGVGPEGGGL